MTPRMDRRDEENPNSEETNAAKVSEEWAQHQQKRKKWILVECGVGVLFLLTVSLVIALGFALSGSSSSNINKSSDVNPPTPPTAPPTNAPTPAPTGYLNVLIQDLPASTLESLKHTASPQSKAENWLSSHPELKQMPEWRKKQLFALAAFYYSMEGENWPDSIKQSFMNYSLHECDWYVDIDCSVGGCHGPNVTKCNNLNRTQILGLHHLQLHTSNPQIPPEIALLTSLKVIALPSNYIQGTVKEFLPTELYQMSHLKRIDLPANQLQGPIPTELGLMTNLEFIHMGSNSLKGTLPSQVGLMTSLTELYLWEAGHLTGSIPTEIGLLKNMENIELVGNAFAGRLPSELGAMSKLEKMHIQTNQFNGTIPTQLGSLSNTLQSLSLRSCDFSGSIPTQLGRLSQMSVLRLNDNKLTGPIPKEMAINVAPNIVRATMHGNGLSGTVPEEFCALGIFSERFRSGFSFDCGVQLCGCDWCLCSEQQEVVMDNVTGEPED